MLLGFLKCIFNFREFSVEKILFFIYFLIVINWFIGIFLIINESNKLCLFVFIYWCLNWFLFLVW